MKWIGQSITDYIARFRSDVYLESLSTTTETNVLVVDSDGKVSKSTTLADDIIESEIDTLAGLTSFGSAGATTNIVAGDVTMYNPVNDGNPTINIGKDANDRLQISAEYHSGAQTMNYARFRTYSSSGSGNAGRFAFEVDETLMFAILDDGINIPASMNFSIGGVDILGDSSGTTTLKNIDVIDTTTTDSVTTSITNRGWNTVDRNITPAVDGSTLHLDACTYTDNNTSEGGTSAAFNTVSIEGSTLAAPYVSTTTNAATLYIKDAVTAGTHKTITNSYALWVDDGAVKFDGALTVGGALTMPDDTVTFAKAVGVTPNVYGNIIKLLPSDFMSNEEGGATKNIQFVDNNASGIKRGSDDGELLAFVSIPEGMDITLVDIYASGTFAVDVIEMEIDKSNGDLSGSSIGTGNCNTQINVADTASTALNYFMIQIVTTSTTNRVYGGQVTIAPQ